MEECLVNLGIKIVGFSRADILVEESLPCQAIRNLLGAEGAQ